MTRGNASFGRFVLACCLWLGAAPATAELGEIQYDTGVLVAPATEFDRTIGNRFDTAAGPQSGSGAVRSTG